MPDTRQASPRKAYNDVDTAADSGADTDADNDADTAADTDVADREQPGPDTYYLGDTHVDYDTASTTVGPEPRARWCDVEESDSDDYGDTPPTHYTDGAEAPNMKAMKKQKSIIGNLHVPIWPSPILGV